MTEIYNKEEQKICIKCGFCCDGTLFLHAGLVPGERGHLPEKIEQNSFSEGGKDFFKLPCLYFKGKCTIYDQKKANVCSSYRCQLLKDFADKKITFHDAQEIVREAMKMRTEIMEQYREISGESENINFIQLLRELGKVQKSVSDSNLLSAEYEMLIARCNIFETLLIKHIRSAGDFESMIGEGKN